MPNTMATPRPTSPGLSYASPPPPTPRHGDEIAIAGEFVHTKCPNLCVLWFDPDGFDAYDRSPPLPADAAPGATPAQAAAHGATAVRVPRHGARRLGGPGGSLVVDREDLNAALTQIVIHYDGCGRSRACFETLHRERGLSCHFLIDRDGRIYQTLDAIERAWHATRANDASVGVELAHVGAVEEEDEKASEFGDDDDAGRFGKKIARGTVNGRRLAQSPFEDAQYEALARLTAALAREFPALAETFGPREPEDTSAEAKLAAEIERVKNGESLAEAEAKAARRNKQRRVRGEKLADAELRAFRGALGHWHVQANKFDPGPAFDWDRYEARTRALLAGETP